MKKPKSKICVIADPEADQVEIRFGKTKAFLTAENARKLAYTLIESATVAEPKGEVRTYLLTRKVGDRSYSERIVARSWTEAEEIAQKLGAVVDGEFGGSICACGQAEDSKPPLGFLTPEDWPNSL